MREEQEDTVLLEQESLTEIKKEHAQKTRAPKKGFKYFLLHKTPYILFALAVLLLGGYHFLVK
ncbi:hypothetical protein AJ85_12715 [Alkalihalobacillus alcalophilus ATCC 27647 = CGMCC 1.3604]|uniref:Uncharacterized protein n=1 Tax=Alkalihalobacillus alcalophilus ATCC 27647 = CGMCC 1.3604 TaxID=1218173 RepID=A0A094WFA1_ALKAL|nr:hypothetical protein BALCAV_0216220 [Alkalihalobacillus alcalophilus ATCC 27647 = CGMCC 1.3604]THG90131.1 hypothetical protein AJ85_12715 [Alkalihalobacillus alcalophilus ATCC 27647 = CGMCC 1.3604]